MEKTIIFKLKRDTYTLKSTIGKLYISDEFFCHTLEDVVRGENIKIDKHTAISAGRYRVEVSKSRRFNRLMPMIYNQDNGYELIAGGISFKGIRTHGGNTHKNTEGCILCAYNRLSNDLIQETAEKELTAILLELEKQEYKIFIDVINLPQAA